jgi:hypothetical protein
MMSTNKSRRPPGRGNTQRRSNVNGFPAYTETLRPGAEPVVPETTPAPAVVMNGSALPKAAAVVVGAPNAKGGATDAEDSPPDSSTRSKEATPEPVHVEKVIVEASEPAPAKDTDAKSAPAAKAKPGPKVDGEEDRKPKAGRGERRARERGKGARGRGASLTPPPADVAAPASDDPPAKSVSAQKEKSDDDGAPVDLDDRFFAEGVQSEREALTQRTHASVHAAEEEEIDPKILLKMHPEVQARRERNRSYVKWAILAAVAIGVVGLGSRMWAADGDKERAAREVEEYKQTHPPGSRTDNAPSAEPAATQAPAAVQAAAAPDEPPPPSAAAAPAGSAPAAPAESAQANAAKPATAAEAKPLEPTAAPATSGAAAAPAEAPLAPAKTAAQEKRDCQVFLDRGANAAAIAAGQRSVGLDPSDGEAWLLLGGAYQVMGRTGEAKHAYSQCVKQGARGPIADCKSMLQAL